MTVEVTYYPVLFGECGGSAGQLGLALFIMSSSEVAGLFFYRRLRKKLRLSWVMLLSLMVYTLKLGLQIWLRNVLGLIILQLLQAGAFGTFLPAVTEMVPGLVPKERTATALSISNACMQGVGVVLGNWTAGAVCEFWGLKTAYTMGACLCCIATVLFVCAFRDRKNTE